MGTYKCGWMLNQLFILNRRLMGFCEAIILTVETEAGIGLVIGQPHDILWQCRIEELCVQFRFSFLVLIVPPIVSIRKVDIKSGGVPWLTPWALAAFSNSPFSHHYCILYIFLTDSSKPNFFHCRMQSVLWLQLNDLKKMFSSLFAKNFNCF